MNNTNERSVIAFAGNRCVAEGAPCDVAVQLRALLDQDKDHMPLIFDANSGEPVEMDLRTTNPEGLTRRIGDGAARKNETKPARSPGRPKLGVVAREVTLLPRHWAWLRAQPGGASVALRKLVERASRASRDQDRIRWAQEACYRLMSALAGNLPGFEEAARALFAANEVRFRSLIDPWPADIRYHVGRLAAGAFGAPKGGGQAG